MSTYNTRQPLQEVVLDNQEEDHDKLLLNILESKRADI